MRVSNEIHPIQGKILRTLLFKPKARFSELNGDKISTDQFSFHLKSLMDAHLLEKLDTAHYVLTNSGKEFANRFDTEKIVIEKQAKITMIITTIKKENGKKYHLVHRRLKQPYYGQVGYINGKIRWGEKIEDAAKREFFEEAGLKASKITKLGVFHKTDYSPDNFLLEDKYFFIFRIDKYSGNLVTKLPEGENFWATKEEYLAMPDKFSDIPDIVDIFDQNKFFFLEKTYIVTGF